jgi:uncharacterized protein (TIGR03089 family)
VQPRTSGAGDRPLVTWYHGAAGQRVELSRATFGNWVAKTANLLVEELGLEAGDHVAVLLPSHWLGPALLAACWRAGISAVPVGPGAQREAAAALLAEAGCAAGFVHEDLLAEVPARFPGGPPPLLVVTDDLLGRSDAELGAAQPFARLAASMPDHFDGQPAAPEAEALLVAEHGGARSEQGGVRSWTQADLAEAAADLGARLGLRDGDRLYSGLGLDRAAGVVAGAAVPTMLGTGVVLERDPDPRAVPERLAAERVTVALLEPEQASAVQAGPGPDPAIRLVVAPLTSGSFRRP